MFRANRSRSKPAILQSTSVVTGSNISINIIEQVIRLNILDITRAYAIYRIYKSIFYYRYHHGPLTKTVESVVSCRISLLLCLIRSIRIKRMGYYFHFTPTCNSLCLGDSWAAMQYLVSPALGLTMLPYISKLSPIHSPS